MARLARYANIGPDEFGRLTPTQTRELNGAVEGLVQQEWRGHLELLLQHARMTTRAR
jgi:hypothetical protein